MTIFCSAFSLIAIYLLCNYTSEFHANLAKLYFCLYNIVINVVKDDVTTIPTDSYEAEMLCLRRFVAASGSFVPWCPWTMPCFPNISADCDMVEQVTDAAQH